MTHVITRKSILASFVIGTVAGFIVALQARAAGDKIAFPENYAQGVMYTTADTDRPDTKEYREYYVTAVTIETLRKGEPIPSGTVITTVRYKARLDDKGHPVKDSNGRFIKSDVIIGFGVKEKRTGWGAEYRAEIRNGEWEYQMFTVDKKVNGKTNLQNCFQCHRPQAHDDFFFTLGELKAAAKAGR